MILNLIDQEIIDIFFKFYKKDLKNTDENLQNYLSNKISQNLEKISDDHDFKEIILQKFSDYNFSFFHVVAKFGSPEDLKKLILLIGIKNLEQTDINNYTALHHSAISGRLENVKILIGFGANITAKSSNETRNWCPIHYACKFGYKNIVEEFIHSQINKEIRTSFGLTPLHVACEYGHHEIVKYLASIGCDLNAETIAENHRLTPLHYAVLINSIKSIETLFKAGADFHKTNDHGDDALILATKRNFSQIVKILINYGLVENINEALSISVNNNYVDSRDIIEIYLKLRDKLFNKNNLIKFSKEINQFLEQTNPQNIDDIMLTIFYESKLSPYFIANITKEVGLIKKTEINLEKFSAQIGLNDLSKGLKKVHEIITHKKLSKKLKI